LFSNVLQNRVGDHNKYSQAPLKSYQSPTGKNNQEEKIHADILKLFNNQNVVTYHWLRTIINK
jgi:hypothetical protein